MNVLSLIIGKDFQRFCWKQQAFLHFECDGMFQPFMCEELSEEVGFYLHVWTRRYVS